MNTSNLRENVQEFNKNVLDNGGFFIHDQCTVLIYVANKTHLNIKHIKPEYKTLVDIGCGDGVYTNEIKQNFPNLRVYGFRPCCQSCTNASKIFPNVEFRAISLLDDNIQLPAKKFDVGVIRGVLHHLADQQKAIENAFKLADNIIIMNPNGII